MTVSFMEKSLARLKFLTEMNIKLMFMDPCITIQIA